MHPAIERILQDWDLEVREARGLQVSLKLEHVSAIIAWVKKGDDRERVAERAGRQWAIAHMKRKIPLSNGKRHYLAACCRTTLHDIMTELARGPGGL